MSRAQRKSFIGVLSLFALVLVGLIPLQPQIVYADDTCTAQSGMYDGVDWEITADCELIIGKDNETQEFTYRARRAQGVFPWYEQRGKIKTGRFAGTVKGNGSMEKMFFGTRAMTSLDVSGFDTSGVTNMYSMFDNAQSLTSLDVSNWDVSQVTNMSSMFASAFALTSLDLSKWNTSKVTDMSFMFSGAASLTYLNVSGWDTSKVKDMSFMFDTIAVTSLDVAGFNTSNVENMSFMFWGAHNLTSLDVSKWDTSKVTSMRSMFHEASSLVSIDVSGWNTSKVTNMGSVFQAARSLKSIDVSGWDTSKVTDMSFMFWGTSALKILDVSSFKTPNVTNMDRMFFDSAPRIGLGEDFVTPGGLPAFDASWRRVGTPNRYPGAELHTQYDGATMNGWWVKYNIFGNAPLKATKSLTGRALEGDDFEFELKQGDTVLQTVKNSVDGTVVFEPIEYDEKNIGSTYTYTITEKNAGASGYTYDDHVLTATVTVTDNDTDKLDVDVSYTGETTFSNTYEASGQVSLDAFTTLTGRTLEADQFEFELRDADGGVVQAVKNAADGTVTFEPIAHTEADVGKTFLYTIVEKNAGAPGYTYDDHTLIVLVSVTDNGNGTLATDIVYRGDTTFANFYNADGYAQLSALKSLTGRALEAEQFEFELRDADGGVVQAVKNAADGTITFDPIAYTEADAGKTFLYTITEKNSGVQGYTYDGHTLTVSVTVTDNGDGTLGTSVAYEGEKTFTNTYVPETPMSTPTPTPISTPTPAPTPLVETGSAVGICLVVAGLLTATGILLRKKRNT